MWYIFAGPWSICNCNTEDITRDTDNYGPARRVAESPFIIVIGTVLCYYSSYSVRSKDSFWAAQIRCTFWKEMQTLVAFIAAALHMQVFKYN